MPSYKNEGSRLFNVELSSESATGTWKTWNLLAWWMSGWHSLGGYTMAIGLFALGLAGGQRLTIAGEPVCQVRFLMDDSKGNAGANRDTVRIGRPMAEVAKWDEAEIAALTAHELAHAVLDHQTWLEHGGQ